MSDFGLPSFAMIRYWFSKGIVDLIRTRSLLVTPPGVSTRWRFPTDIFHYQ